MENGSNYVIRRSDRHEIVLPCRLRVHESEDKQVRLSSRSGHQDGWVSGDLIDIALGGAGLITTSFFPRGSLIDFELHELESQGLEPILEIGARVRRVAMMDRRPSYMIGVLFDRPSPNSEGLLAKLIDRIMGSEDSPKTATSPADRGGGQRV